MFNSILIPTDGSQEMEPVVEKGVELAALCEATLHTIHVVDERAYLTVPDDARDQVRYALEEDANMAVRTASELASEANLEVVENVRWGDPSAEILAYAVEHDIDLIVMGTHGRTGYERYLLGSVAEKVMRVSPMPVLTIAVGDTEETIQKIQQHVGEPTDNAVSPGDTESGSIDQVDEPR